MSAVTHMLSGPPPREASGFFGAFARGVSPISDSSSRETGRDQAGTASSGRRRRPRRMVSHRGDTSACVTPARTTLRLGWCSASLGVSTRYCTKGVVSVRDLEQDVAAQHMDAGSPDGHGQARLPERMRAMQVCQARSHGAARAVWFMGVGGLAQESNMESAGVRSRCRGDQAKATDDAVAAGHQHRRTNRFAPA